MVQLQGVTETLTIQGVDISRERGEEREREIERERRERRERRVSVCIQLVKQLFLLIEHRALTQVNPASQCKADAAPCKSLVTTGG